MFDVGKSMDESWFLEVQFQSKQSYLDLALHLVSGVLSSDLYVYG